MLKHTFIGEGVAPGHALYDVYRLWETADGRILWFATLDAEYHGLFRALGKPEWCEDPRYGSVKARTENLAELGTEIMKLIAELPTRELLARMIEEDVPAGAVLSIEEMLEDEQLRHNEAIIETEHPTAGAMRMARPPARFHGTPQTVSRLAPNLGEHTDEVLAGLGYDAAKIASLRADGVIA